MSSKKKVLIITYYWPPAGGIGVLRCLKLAKYLRDFGWEPVIYTTKDADFPYFDKDNLRDVPENIEIIKRPIVEPFSIFKKLTGRGKEMPLNNIVHVRDKQSLIDKLGIWVRGNFFVPDARFLWIKPSVRFLKKYVRENKIDAILTDGPPHTNTAIGLKLAQSVGIPWLADFQDPWTQVDYYKLFKIGKRANRKHHRLEQAVFKQANKITIASPTWGQELESIGARDTSVWYYGYDEDDFKQLTQSPDALFTICHAGLLGFDRNPQKLLLVLSELCDEIDEFRNNLSLKMMGQIDFEVLEQMELLGLKGNLNDLGTVNRKTVIEEINNSWILLLPINKAENAKGRIPGKLYEYLRVLRPILCLGPHDGDVADIIKESNAGVNFEYEEKEELKKWITQMYTKFTAGAFKEENNLESIEKYSNLNQTKRIVNILDEIYERG